MPLFSPFLLECRNASQFETHFPMYISSLNLRRIFGPVEFSLKLRRIFKGAQARPPAPGPPAPHRAGGRGPFPSCKKPPLADFWGVSPLATQHPPTGAGQGPTSPQTGRLAGDCVSNRPALTGGGRRIKLHARGKRPISGHYLVGLWNSARVLC